MISAQQINALHSNAMDLASRAFRADIKADYQTAKALFREAFDLERQAAEAVAPDFGAEPSRSVLLRSAASLALDCHEFRETERLVAIALSGNPRALILPISLMLFLMRCVGEHRRLRTCGTFRLRFVRASTLRITNLIQWSGRFRCHGLIC